MTVHMQIEGLPISSNHAYINLPKGGRTLSKEGRKYKAETSGYLVRTFPTEMMIFKKDVPFGYLVQFCFPNLFNKGWPEKAKTRYKKLDVSNRLKLFEDALFNASGVDDSQVCSGHFDKIEGPAWTHVWAWNMEEECPFQWKM